MSVSEEIHLLRVDDAHNSIEESDTSDSDDDVEVVSSFDTRENELVDMSNYLRIDSFGQPNANHDDPSAPGLMIGDTCSESDSKNEDPPADCSRGCSDSTTVSSSSLSLLPTPTTNDTLVVNTSGTSERKRRQWCVAEKLKALTLS